MRRKRFPFTTLAATAVVAAAIALGLPAEARASGMSPGDFATATSSVGTIAGNSEEGDCTARFGGREIFCHHLNPASESVDTTPPRGEDGPQLAAGFVNLVPRPVITHVPASPGVVPPLQIPRFLFGVFRS
jgi:hypothetical protein